MAPNSAPWGSFSHSFWSSLQERLSEHLRKASELVLGSLWGPRWEPFWLLFGVPFSRSFLGRVRHALYAVRRWPLGAFFIPEGFITKFNTPAPPLRGAANSVPCRAAYIRETPGNLGGSLPQTSQLAWGSPGP